MIYELTECKGILIWNEKETEVNFAVSVADDGNVKIVFDPLPLNTQTSWLHGFIIRAGLTAEKITLKGSGPDGSQIRSTAVFITSEHPRSTPLESTMSLEATTGVLTIHYPNLPTEPSSQDALLQYFPVGLRGFRTVRSRTEVGEISVAAQSKVSDFSELTCCIAVKKIKDGDLEVWFTEADKLVQSLLEILSLADGRFIDWSVRQFYKGGKLHSVNFYGARVSSDPIEPLFSHLDLQPVVDLAVSKYTSALRDETGLGIAIEWFLMHPKYIEAQYLVAMTALEHLLHKHKHADSQILPKRDFAAISLRITDQLDSLGPEISAAMKRKLPELNRRTFGENLDRFLGYYKVPLTDIGRDQITRAIQVRNTIVHRGFYTASSPDQASLLQNLAILRELLKRIFLSILEYRGQYCSFLNGPTWLQFPTVPKR